MNIMKYKKRGFTLIELLISLAILGIVLTAIFNFNIFGLRTFARGEERYNIQNDVRSAADFITKQLRYAQNIDITTSTPILGDGYNYIRSEGSTLKYYSNGKLINTIPTTGSALKYSLSLSRSSDRTLSFTINGEGRGTKYGITSKVACINLGEGERIETSSGTTSIRYKVNKSLTDLMAVPGNGRIDLTFSSSQGATAVKLLMSTVSESSGFSEVPVVLNSVSTSAFVAGLINGTKYYFKLIITGGEREGESNVVSAVPFAPTELTAGEVADSITSIAALPKNASELELPVVPSGFDIFIKSSTQPSIISTVGEITPQSTDNTVALVFTVKRLSDGTTADTAILNVLVKAKSAGLENVRINVVLRQLINTTTAMQYSTEPNVWINCTNGVTSNVKYPVGGCTVSVRDSSSTRTIVTLYPPEKPQVTMTLTKSSKAKFTYDSSLDGALEFSTNSASTWNSISTSTEVNINNSPNVIVRKKATETSLPSTPTGDLNYWK